MKKYIDMIRRAIGKINFGLVREFRIELLLERLNRLSNESALSGVTPELYCGKNVIVSLTTHGRRIHQVYLTLESLMQQTLKPNKIVLWLGKDEFSDNNIPIKLKRLRSRGLEIGYVEDVGPYTKIIPALQKYPEEIIVTVDDDVLYHDELIEHLVNGYKQNPRVIHFCRGHRIKLDKDGQPLAYKDWLQQIEDMNVDRLNFPTGIGGVLYPPHALHEDATRADLFMKLCPTADDIWLKVMALLNGSESCKVYTTNKSGCDYCYIDYNNPEDEVALCRINIGLGKNDEQIKALLAHYGLSLQEAISQG